MLLFGASFAAAALIIILNDNKSSFSFCINFENYDDSVICMRHRICDLESLFLNFFDLCVWCSVFAILSLFFRIFFDLYVYFEEVMALQPFRFIISRCDIRAGVIGIRDNTAEAIM